MNVEDALTALKVDHDATLLAIETAGPPRVLQINPGRDVSLDADTLIAVAATRPPGSAKP